MTKRDYIIIFLLLLPFFVTLPWALITRHQLKRQVEVTESVRDSLSYMKWYYRSRLETVESIRQQNEELEKNRRLQNFEETPDEVIEETIITPPSAANQPAAFADTNEYAAWKEREEAKRIQATIYAEEMAATKEIASTAPAVSTTEPVAVANSSSDIFIPEETGSGPEADIPPAPPPIPQPAFTPAASPKSVRLVPEIVSLRPVAEGMWRQMGVTKKTAMNTEAVSISLAQEILPGEASSITNPRRLEVDITLNGIPEVNQGNRTFYLIVTDRGGAPVSGSSPVPVRLPMNGIEIEMTALTKQNIRLQENQNIRFTQMLDKGLPSGNYRVQVFSETDLVVMKSLTVR